LFDVSVNYHRDYMAGIGNEILPGKRLDHRTCQKWRKTSPAKKQAWISNPNQATGIQMVTGW